MNIQLLHKSPLWLASHAIRMSHANHDKSDSYEEVRTYNLEEGVTTYEDRVVVIGEKDKELIARVGNKLRHKSVLEQLVYWFDIDGISRACLQELARHRTARLTVKSSRYTLKELKEAKEIKNVNGFSTENIRTSQDFLVWSGDVAVDLNSMLALSNLQSAIKSGISNDVAKYCLPEAFKTRLQWQIDGRNLQNFLELRTAPHALKEIRELAYNIFNSLPEEHRYLYEGCIYKELK